MKNKIKLFPGTIIGLVLGILVAVPLFYATAVVTPTLPSSDNGLCNVEILYSYLERQNTTTLILGCDETGHLITEDLDEPNVRAKVVFNLTRNFPTVIPSEAELWIYQIEFYTDKGSISNTTRYIGVLSKEPAPINSLDDIPFSTFQQTVMDPIMNFTKHVHEIYGGEFGGGGVYTYWSVGQSLIEHYPVSTNDGVSVVDASEKIFVRIKELGWAVYTDSIDITILSEPNVLADVQLETYNDGYLYNAAISEGHLTEIDLLDPAPWDFDQ